jgi:hypothetical protein
MRVDCYDCDRKYYSLKLEFLASTDIVNHPSLPDLSNAFVDANTTGGTVDLFGMDLGMGAGITNATSTDTNEINLEDLIAWSLQNNPDVVAASASAPAPTISTTGFTPVFTSAGPTLFGASESNEGGDYSPDPISQLELQKAWNEFLMQLS